MSFVTIPAQLLSNKKVPKSAINLWLLLKENAAGVAEIWLSHKALAMQLGCAPSTVSKNLKILKEQRVIPIFKPWPS